MGEQEKLRTKKIMDEVFDLQVNETKPDGVTARNSLFLEQLAEQDARAQSQGSQHQAAND